MFSQVLANMGELDEAVKRLEKAKSLDSEERAIQIELEKALQKRKAQQERERKMYRRMMEGEKPAKQTKVEKSQDNGWVSDYVHIIHYLEGLTACVKLTSASGLLAY